MSASVAATVVWGLALLAAFAGWGGVLATWLFGRQRIDFGLRAVWGLSLTIFAGGTAALFRVASQPVVVTFVCVGVILFLVTLFLHPPRFDVSALGASFRNYPGSVLLALLCIAAASIQYLASICNLEFNPNDDFVAYFPFAKQILQQGTLFDPFSTRRVMSYGGQSLLHALVLAGMPGFRLHMLDQGVCLLLTGLLVAGAAQSDRGSRYPLLLALLLLLSFPDISINTYAQFSGVVIFLGLYRTLVWVDERNGDGRPLSNAIVIALLASAACTLRSNYIAVCVPMVALSYAFYCWRGGAERAARLREAIQVALLSALFLAPWMLMSYESSGTALFPIFRGHFNDAFPMLQAATNWRDQVSDLYATVRHHHLMPTFWLVFLGGMLLPGGRSRKPLHALLLASVIGWLLLVHMLASDIPSFERYIQGFLVAAVLAVLISIPSAKGLAAKIGCVLAVVGALWQLRLVTLYAIDRHDGLLRKIDVIARLPIQPSETMLVAKSYRAVQARIPPRETLLVMVDHPFLLDFRRNAIYNIDTAAAVSPPPGFPYFRGPEAVADYLRAQSIRYVAFVPPESARSLYKRHGWERQRDDPHAYWHEQAPVYLDLFDNMQKLAASRRRLYADSEVVLLDLATSAAASRPPE